jgi:hypothetical protein
MSSTAEFRKAFVDRLVQACETAENVPPPHKGRQQYISRELEVAPEAVSKWFKAVSMPKPDRMEKLAELLQVEQTWLAFGVSPEMDRKERKTHGRELNGAVHFVMGKAMLAGSNCGFPGPRDPRAEYVDFYATVGGMVRAVHVCLGREIERDKYEVAVPKQYEELDCVAVIPRGPGNYDELDMPNELITDHAIRKPPGYVIMISRKDNNRYTTGRTTWPQIKYFGNH